MLNECRWLTGSTVEDPCLLKEIMQAYLYNYSMRRTDWLMLQRPLNTKLHRIDLCQFCIIHTTPIMFSATIFTCCVLAFLCIHRKYKGNMCMQRFGLTTHTHTHLFDTAGVLLHGNLFHSALKAEEGLDVQAGGLLKTRPLVILWVNLYQHTQTRTVYYTVYTCRSKMTRLLW